METLVGHVTKDAAVATTKTGKQVVNFSIAISDNYKTKSGEAKESVRHFNCAYWISTGIAKHLLKGAMVS